MTSETMKAWVVDTPGPIDSHPLRRVERSVPVPGPGQVRLRVRVCGVCRTDLHLAEGDLPPKHHHVIPGHEVVGIVDRLGAGCTRFGEGDRIGVPWLAHTCGTCRFCTAGRENLCIDPRFTGWDLDGGYAPYVVVDEKFAYPIPRAFSDEEAAPLLCAGIIGYRALRRSHLPEGGRLGIYGFGGSLPYPRTDRHGRGSSGSRDGTGRQGRVNWRSSSGRPAPTAPTIRRPNPWMPPSSSPPWARWSCPRFKRSMGGACWPSPEST